MRIEDQCTANLSHIPESFRENLKLALINMNVIVDSFDDLCPAKLPIEHEFELIDDWPIYFKPRRLLPLLNNVVEKEVSGTLKKGFIRPIVSPWVFMWYNRTPGVTVQTVARPAGQLKENVTECHALTKR